MPFFNYKCNKCDKVGEFLVGSTNGAPVPTDCPECGAENCMEKQFSMDGIGGEVVGGYEYEYGKKSWKRNASQIDKASILSGDKNPY